MLNSRYRFVPFNNTLAMSEFSKQRAREFAQACSELKNLHCMICGKNDYQPISDIDRYGFYYPTGLCKHCGNLQQTKYYQQTDLDLFYSEIYRDVYGNMSGDELFANQVQKGSNILEFISDALGGKSVNKKSVLEIGTGAGGILLPFKKCGCSVLGLDFDGRYIEKGREHGIEIVEGGLNTLEEGTKFDLIIISHVLEHVIDVQKFLHDISSYLLPDGYLYIEVPSLHIVCASYDCNFLRYFQNAHTIHFSRCSYQNLIGICGYQEIKGDKFIHSVCVYTGEKKNIKSCYKSP